MDFFVAFARQEIVSNIVFGLGNDRWIDAFVTKGIPTPDKVFVPFLECFVVASVRG